MGAGKGVGGGRKGRGEGGEEAEQASSVQLSAGSGSSPFILLHDKRGSRLYNTIVILRRL
jgi:hypothetical protein